MRRSLIIAAAGMAALALSACRAAPVENTPVEKSYRIAFRMDNVVYVSPWTDPETGCEYLITDDGFAQPRMQNDGSQRCYRPDAATEPAGAPIQSAVPTVPSQ